MDSLAPTRESRHRNLLKERLGPSNPRGFALKDNAREGTRGTRMFHPRDWWLPPRIGTPGKNIRSGRTEQRGRNSSEAWKEQEFP